MSLQLKNLDRAIRKTVELREKVHRSEHLDRMGTMLAVEHRNRVPVEEGTLKGSIRHKVVNAGKQLLVGVGREAFYWRFIEKGARRHEIRVKPGRRTRSRKGAKVLASEAEVFGKRVMHPGIWPPRPFVRPVIEGMRIEMTETLKKSLREAKR